MTMRNRTLEDEQYIILTLRSSSLSCGLSKSIDPRYWGEIEDFLENCVTSVI